jgi:hypothetical protein
MGSVTVSGDVIPIQRRGFQPAGAFDPLVVSDVVKTVKLTLVDLPVPIVSVTTGNGVGGARLYKFPAGFIKRLGCRARLTFSIAAAEQGDFTDGTPDGDVGIGTAVPADADALGTDATDDDWGTATPIAFAAFAITTPVAVPSEADGVHDGSSTPVEVFLNMLIDAADIDDDATTEILVSGTVWLSWLNQGGA